MKYLLPVFLFILLSITVEAQQMAKVFGRITDSQTGLPVDMIVVQSSSASTTTNKNGEYILLAKANEDVTISVKSLIYKDYTQTIHLAEGSEFRLDIVLQLNAHAIKEVNITDIQSQTLGLVTINPKEVEMLPSASGNLVESFVKTFAGVYSNNELSSQYSVRGGNFDENLVYINDIEVHRPFLVRSGQQEGLSAINSDMVSSIHFSAGGFDAKYGDKMSSVLDIKYKKPDTFAASTNVSLLGASFHFEGASRNKKFTHITGVRYKTSEYLLKTLETKGEYKPRFFDVQTYLTYNFSDKFEISFLGNLARNSYEFIPTDRNTDFGTIENSINIYVDYEGKEMDRFTSGTGAFTAHYHPNKSLSLKLITSAYQTLEEETFDIDGSYMINQLDSRLGTAKHDSMLNLGIGRYLNHARNYLKASVYSVGHRGTFRGRNLQWDWGTTVDINKFDDKLNEWKLIDSAGYILPHSDRIPYNDTVLTMSNTTNVHNHLNTYKISAFVQTFANFSVGQASGAINAGIRACYLDISDEILISPRVIVSLKPAWKRDVMFRLSGGVYSQPPFYRELRDLDGTINYHPKAQRSYQALFGTDIYFSMWQRQFKFTGEMYYKWLKNLIPYQIDNVRIRYYANEKANGYATGIDLKVNGEFVPGVESWASLSFMQTREDIFNDGHGYIPRPTDQLVNVGLFFQDYLPGNKSYKMNLSFIVGSRLPFGPTNYPKYADTLRMPGYKRVDIGFSKVIKSEFHKITNKRSIWRHFKSVWISFEIFNLLGIGNVISYDWLNVVPNSANPSNDTYSQYAVPNRLTDRRYNLKLSASF